MWRDGARRTASDREVIEQMVRDSRYADYWRLYIPAHGLTGKYYDRLDGKSFMAKSTERYCNTVKEVRARLLALDKKYQPEKARLETFRGSEGYEDEKERIETAYHKEKERALQGLKADFDDEIATMRKSATSRKMKAPTQEQLNLLNTLNMMDKLTESDVEQAKNVLQDNPLAMKRLAEMAGAKGEDKHGNAIHLETQAIMSNDDVEKHLQSLERNANKLLSIEHYNDDTMRESISHYGSETYKNDYDTFTIMNCGDTEEDTMRVFGNVTGDDVKTFNDAVNTPQWYLN